MKTGLVDKQILKTGLSERMRKVLARPWVGVQVCHLLLLFLKNCSIPIHFFFYTVLGIKPLVFSSQDSSWL